MAGDAEATFVLTPPQEWNQFDLEHLPRPPLNGPEAWSSVPERRGPAVLEVESAQLVDGTGLSNREEHRESG